MDREMRGNGLRRCSVGSPPEDREVLAIVPARTGSRGIPNKNFRPLAGGPSCVDRALFCARQADIPARQIVLSTDHARLDEIAPGLA